MIDYMLDGSIRTPDTPLATHLLIEKEKCLGIEFIDGQGFYIFASSETLKINLNKWTPDYICNRFYRQYHSTLKWLHSEQKSQVGRRNT